jgi:hypothetical protein
MARTKQQSTGGRAPRKPSAEAVRVCDAIPFGEGIQAPEIVPELHSTRDEEHKTSYTLVDILTGTVIHW